MTVSQATAEVFSDRVAGAAEEERQAVLARITEDEEWREDVKDFAVFFAAAKRAVSPFPRVS